MGSGNDVPPLAGDERELLERIARWLPVLSGQVKALQRSRWWLTRAFVVSVAVVAVTIAALAIVFTVWNVNQDEVRARNHQATLDRIALLEQQLVQAAQQNTLFRRGACTQAEHWKIYLDANPGDTPASRKAAHEIAATANTLCSSPVTNPKP